MTDFVYIYTLTDPRNGEVRYIGKTTEPQRRFWEHMSEVNNTHKSRWVQSLRSMGFQPKMDIIDTMVDPTKVEWENKEQFWIAHYKLQGARLTNLTVGGDGVNGHKHSVETKFFLAEMQKGRVTSEQTKERLRERSARRVLSDVQVLEIRQRFAKGDILQLDLANEYGVAASLIANILTGKRRQAVGGPIITPTHRRSDNKSNYNSRREQALNDL